MRDGRELIIGRGMDERSNFSTHHGTPQPRRSQQQISDEATLIWTQDGKTPPHDMSLHAAARISSSLRTAIMFD